jgi:MYXO-CTERM domain-containing protein
MNRIILSTSVILSLVSAASAQTTAFRSTHIGVDTATGAAGEQLLLKTGYGTSGAPESEAWSYRFENGNLGGQLQTRTQRYAANSSASFAQVSYNLKFDAPATLRAAEGGGASPVAGWRAFSSLAAQPSTEKASFNPTSGDAFVAAGRLTGGDFAYEILSVTPLAGSPAASFAIGLMERSGITTDSQRRLQTVNLGYDVFGVYNAAQGGGGSLSDRSIFLGNGNHFHGWGFFISDFGQYEVAMRLYDTTGKFAASEAFTFQINSVPSTGGLAALALAGLTSARRRRVA